VITDRAFCFLDEPFEGVDARVAARCVEGVCWRAMTERGTTIF